jgi:hypothetical protein
LTLQPSMSAPLQMSIVSYDGINQSRPDSL